MNITDVLDKVPDYQVFYTVAELDKFGEDLAAAHPAAVERFSIGNSREGRPIWCMKIGTGAKKAVCFACPHPNEPIGAMTVVTLARLFTDDATLLEDTGMTWYLIPCIDPDATRLNEGWFKGPFNLYMYARNFYRPAGNEQVEWTFPFEYKGRYFEKPLPETTALTTLIEEVVPQFVFSLHNSSFGGAYWYSNKNVPGLNEKLENAAVRQRIPLHMGEPEASYSIKYSGAVFSALSLKASFDEQEKNGKPMEPGEMWCGTTSSDFVETVNPESLNLMAELPYFCDPRSADTSPSDMTRREALQVYHKDKKEIYDFFDKHWDAVAPLFSAENIFPRLTADCIKGYHKNGKPEEMVGPEYDRPATVAEKFDNLVSRNFYEVLFIALAVRGCEYELAREGAHTPEERAVLQEKMQAFDAELKRWCDKLEANSNYEAIEIKRLVSVQLESALLVTQYV